ncbi:hypothetical protein VNI00_016251 [Paramarasmius palmivorus]|uniref:FAD-binding PCMH-type domain-containing protein n=1 Tax=Paramarasmius palmivorus TaxID=297713 RepID=A0AAW0BDQ6_9AGAR
MHFLLLLYLPLLAVASLRHQFAHEGIKAIFPGDAAYVNASRAYNMRFDPSPIAVTYPINVQQVSLVVNAGAKEGVRVVARSGGHSYIANSLGSSDYSPALVVDLSNFDNITYDPTTETAVIQPGNRLGQVALALNEHGRAMPHGRCSWVGFGGHSGFGGWGFPSRMWGLTLDNVLGAEVVLANGTIVHVSEDENVELFWAVRGSSASFGIVTSIIVRTHPTPAEATSFQYVWDMDVSTAISTFEAFQEFALSDTLPVEFGGELGMLKGTSRGRVTTVFLGGYYGPHASYNDTVGPFLNSLPLPRNDSTVVQGTWIDAVRAGAAGDIETGNAQDMPRDTFYAKSLMTDENGVSREAMGALMEYLGGVGFDSDTFWHVEVEIYGGARSAVNAIPVNSTAFGRRSSLFTFQPYASTGDLLPPWDNSIFGFVDGMVHSVVSSMPSDWDYGAYANYIDARLPDWQHRYYSSNYPRLQKIKGDLDPKNVFSFPFFVRASLRDRLAIDGIHAVFPGDVDYANASRAYNMRFNPNPIAVTYPINAEQVSQVVRAGAKEGMRVVARSGGHSYIANSLGSSGYPPALVVDLSSFRNITYDPSTKTAMIQPGIRLGNVVSTLNEHGRAIPHGRCSWVGFGGHSGFGGWGHPSRLWGLTLDNILSAEVVLANGTIVHASEDKNHELFWAIRGSSPSFGIVTSTTVRTHATPPEATLFQYLWDMDVSLATFTFKSFQAYALSSELPAELGGELGILKGTSRGRVTVMFFGSYYGSHATYNETVKPFLNALPPPRNDSIVVQGTWIDAIRAAAAGDLETGDAQDMPRDTFYAKSLMTDENGVNENAMSGLLEHLGGAGFDSDDFWAVEIEIYGGVHSAINSVPLESTAFGRRNSLFTFQLYGSTDDRLPPWDDTIFKFVGGMVDEVVINMPDDWGYGAYANYIDARLPDWQHLYYSTHYPRLQKLKRELDPGNVFRFQQSIEI